MDGLSDVIASLFDASPAMNAAKLVFLSIAISVGGLTLFAVAGAYVIRQFVKAGGDDAGDDPRGPRHGRPIGDDAIASRVAREASYREDSRVTEDWLDHEENRQRIARERAERDARRASGNLSYCDRISGMGDAIGNVGDWMRGHFMPDRDEPRDEADDGRGEGRGEGQGGGPVSSGRLVHRGRPSAVGSLPACGAWPRRPSRVITARSGVFAGESVRVIGESGEYPGVWFVEGRGGRVSVVEGVTIDG